MTLGELQRFAPKNPQAWEARLDDVLAAAMHLAYSARVEPEYCVNSARVEPAGGVAEHWRALPTAARSLWFAAAWKLVTGQASP